MVYPPTSRLIDQASLPIDGYPCHTGVLGFPLTYILNVTFEYDLFWQEGEKSFLDLIWASVFKSAVYLF